MRSAKEGVEVPYSRLRADVVRRVTEEFVSRDGTDYGEVEKTLEEKVADVTRQLERGTATIVYDADTDTINVIRAEDLMGDKSPKSKQRGLKQKSAAKANDAAAARAKQDAHNRASLPGQRDKK